MRSVLRSWFFVSLIAAVLVSAVQNAIAQPAIVQKSVTPQEEIVSEIIECLKDNKEAVLFDTRIRCANYRDGNKALIKRNAGRRAQNIDQTKHYPGTPGGVDLERDCPSPVHPGQPIDQPATQKTASKRWLSTRTIWDLMKRKDEIGAHGIRIVGALFCDKVDLVGLNLPFSLILDSSVFKKGIEIRNVTIDGDLSFDRSYVFNQLRILRSHFRGSVFGDESFVKDLYVSETEVDGSILFRESVLFHLVQLNGALVVREFSLRSSALSQFITQFSKIDGLLDLSYSQARCGYHVTKSEVGYLIAKKAGFGTIDQASGANKAAWYAWHDHFDGAVKDILSSREVDKEVSNTEECQLVIKKNVSEFFIFDSRINSTLCVSEFQWLAPRGGPPDPASFANPRNDDSNPLTVVAINGTSIGNNLIIDLWAEKKNVHDRVSRRLHKLEAIGVKTAGLIIDFSDSDRPYFTAIDGLIFDRVYDAQAVCDAGTNSQAADGQKSVIIRDFGDQLQLPKIEDVRKWLDLNEIGSTQSFTAFATAFENAGGDSTGIKVDRANREVCERAAYWLLSPILKSACPAQGKTGDRGDVRARQEAYKRAMAAADSERSGWGELGAAFAAIPIVLSDLAQLLFRGILWILADHGYRPGKVLWWVTITLIVFWLVFWFWLKVVAFSSKTNGADQSSNPGPVRRPDEPRPIGFVFLFDRLIPNYRIIDENYRVDKYFRRIPLGQAAGAAQHVKRLGIEWPVTPIEDLKDVARIERWLLALRLLGLVFTIFLAAAIGALVVH